MISVNYKGYRRNVYVAVDKVNALLAEDDFYEQISAHPYFDMADILPAHIADLIKLSDIRMQLDFYYSISPSGKAYGYDNIDEPYRICLNAWKIERPVPSICNTIVHACVHAVNDCFKQYSFGHGNGAAMGNENTAPYWIGCLAQRMISGNVEVCEYMIHDEPENIIDVSAKRSAGAGRFYSLLS